MSCYRPLRAFRLASGGVCFDEKRYHGDIIGDIFLPCGMCIGCRAKRAADWSLRCMHEASLRDANCFVTLTYGADLVPPGGALCHRDFQLFMKRLRKRFGFQVRYFMCGEYGETTRRPHYHACLFGVDFRSDRTPIGKSASGYVMYTSPTLVDLWTHGLVTVQELTKETSGYCARYVMKKLLGRAADEPEARKLREWTDAEGEVHERPVEYAAMSLKPGIGYDWFSRFARDVYPHDFVVREGSKERPPKYYDKLMARSDRSAIDDIKFDREVESRKSAEHQTPRRLADREVVHTARLRNQLRSLD